MSSNTLAHHKITAKLDEGRILACALVLVIASCGPAAQDAGPASQGSDQGPGAMISVFAAIDTHVQASMAQNRTPGVALALTTGEDLIGVRTWGYADLHRQMPVTEETLFQIGSITKSFTALALLQQWDKGRFDPNALVTDYLPWWKVRSTYEPIRVEHLLTHTAGIPGNRDDIFSSPYMAWALREQQTAWPPGSRFLYSNVGYQTLHFVLEEVSGQPYATLIEKKIFEPLGMTHSRPTITLDSRNDQAVGYLPPFDDRPMHSSRTLVAAPHHEYGIGDGCIQSTAADMAAYVRMWLNRGATPDQRIVSSEAFERFAAPHPASFSGSGTLGYGFGVDVLQDRDRLYLLHDGGMVGFVSQVIADMTGDIGVVVLMNGPGEPHVVAEYALSALRAELEGQPLPEPPARVDPSRVENGADYAGHYESVDGKETLSFDATEDRLFLVHSKAPLILHRIDEDAFYTPDLVFDRYLFKFGRDNDGQVVEVAHGPDWYVHDRYDGPLEFELPEAWSTYVGRYRSFSPWSPYFEIATRKGQLVMITGEGGETSFGATELVPKSGDSFQVGQELTPENLSFEDTVDGQALRATWSGHPFFRSAN